MKVELVRACRSEKSVVLKFETYPALLGGIFEGVVLFYREVSKLLGAKVLPVHNPPEVPYHEA